MEENVVEKYQSEPTASEESGPAQNRSKRFWTVPFGRDHGFVGREDILAELKTKFQREAPQHHAQVVLVGVGGVGKSQIAIEYAYRLRKFAPDISVFWVRASNAARVEQTYRDIAAILGLLDEENSRNDIMQLVCDWLSDEKNGRWLMIFDDVDDEDWVLSSPDPSLESGFKADYGDGEVKALSRFLPQSPNAWILVTSRHLEAVVNLVGEKASVTRVHPMKEDDALLLLRKRVPPVWGSPEEDQRRLVKTLDCIPLAVTHAAGYITETEQSTVLPYLDLLRQRSRFTEGVRGTWRGHDVSNSVLTTILILLEWIKSTDPHTADLLLLMAMFDRQGIPKSIMPYLDHTLDFRGSEALLIRVSLIRRQHGMYLEKAEWEDQFDMHRLVQLTVRRWLELDEQMDMWQAASLRVMATGFPNWEQETLTAWMELLPHSRKVVRFSCKTSEAKRDQATIASATGGYLIEMGKCAIAMEFLQQALVTREEILGLEHPDTLYTVNQLGNVWERQGQYEEAEAMYRRALLGRERILGLEDPDTFDTVSELGNIWEKQGRYEEAQAMYRRALQVWERILGLDHADTLEADSQLQNILKRQENYREANAIYRRVLSRSKNLTRFLDIPGTRPPTHDFLKNHFRSLGTFFGLIEAPCPPHRVRMRWKCKCNTKGFDDLTILDVGGISALRKMLESNSSIRFTARFQEPNDRTKLSLHRLWSGPLTLLRNAWMSVCKPSKDNPTLPQHNHQGSIAAQDSGTNPTHSRLLLLCGYRKGRYGKRLVQHDIDTVRNDKDLFGFLRQTYLQHRGLFRSKISLRGLKYMNLVKFHLLTKDVIEVIPHEMGCKQRCECVPPEYLTHPWVYGEYQCQPVPPKLEPPFPPNMLMHLFDNPGCLDDSQTWIFNQTPKRICGKLEGTPEKITECWGFHFQEDIDAKKIAWFILILFLSGSLLFGIVWSALKDDVQAAFGVASWIVTFGAILLSLLVLHQSEI